MASQFALNPQSIIGITLAGILSEAMALPEKLQNNYTQTVTVIRWYYQKEKVLDFIQAALIDVKTQSFQDQVLLAYSVPKDGPNKKSCTVAHMSCLLNSENSVLLGPDALWDGLSNSYNSMVPTAS